MKNKYLVLFMFAILIFTASLAYCEDNINILSPQEILNKAKAFYAEGKYQEANVYYSRLAQLLPDNSFVQFATGRSYEELKKYDEAILYYQKTISLNPNSRESYVGIGIVYCKQAKYEEGILMFKRALDFNCTNEDRIIIKRNIELAEKKIKLTRQSYMNNALELSPNDALTTNPFTYKPNIVNGLEKTNYPTYRPSPIDVGRLTARMDQSYLNTYNANRRAAVISNFNAKLDSTCRNMKVPNIPSDRR